MSRTSTTRTWLAIAAGLWLALPASAQAGILRGPVLHPVGPGAVSVSWDTSGEEIGRVEVRGPDGLPIELSETELGTHHVLNFEGLAHWGRYTYQVAGAPGTSGGGTFTVAGDDRRAFHFTVAGDTRTQPFYHRAVLDRVLAERPLIHINTGDLVASGEVAAQWDTFFRVERELLRRVPLLPVVGNHDKDPNTLYDDLWRLPGVRDQALWYSVRLGNLVLLSIDYSQVGDGQTEQDLWLAAELAAAEADPELDHIVPSLHVPPLSSGPHGNDLDLLARLQPLFSQHGVQLVLCGHDHSYERSLYEGIHYVVAGGGGAPQGGSLASTAPNPQEHSQIFVFAYSYARIDVSGTRLVLTAFDLDGDRLDRVEISP